MTIATPARLILSTAVLAASFCLADPVSMTPSASTQPASTQPAATRPSAQEQLPGVTVSGVREKGYVVTNAYTGSRMDIPARELPQSVDVVPNAVIEDRGLTRVSEIGDSAPGLQFSPGYGGLPSGEFFSRGFNATTFHDGFRIDGFYEPYDISGVDRVEVLKGPSSLIYGLSSPGGIVNIVSKRPMFAQQNTLQYTYGSFDYSRYALDLTGPIAHAGGGDPNMAYRLVSSYEKAGSFRDYNKDENVYLAPSFTWRISEQAKLTLFAEYQRSLYTFDRNLPPAEQTFKVPISRFLGEPGQFGHAQSWRAGYEFIDKLSDNWQFRSAFAGTQAAFDANFVQGFDFEADGTTLDRSSTHRAEGAAAYVWQNELTGKFKTGPFDHYVLAGVELFRDTHYYTLAFGNAPSINFFNPHYGFKIPYLALPPQSKFGDDTLGIYAQDQITLFPKFKVLAGIRYDDDRNTTFDPSSFSAPVPTLKTTIQRFSPRVGLTYDVVQPVTLFADWTRSFVPNGGLSRTGAFFAPEDSEQYEGGVKYEFLKNRLSGSAAVYQIVKKNVLATDPTDPDFSVITGEQRSRGVELNLIGQVAPGWTVLANYAYTDARVTHDTTIPIGSRVAPIPYNQAGIWTGYEFQYGTLKGFGAGAGVYYVGEREAVLPSNGVHIPDYFRCDAELSYRRNNWHAQLNFKNLFNQRYYDSQGFILTPGAPLTVEFTVSYGF